MVPRPASWEELGFAGIPDRRPSIPSGAELLGRLPAGEQRAILGPTRYRLYREGALDLRDLVRPTYNPPVGPRPTAGEPERTAPPRDERRAGSSSPHP